MDSEIQRDGRVLDLTDDAWREDKLPYEDVTIPLVNQRLHYDTHVLYSVLSIFSQRDISFLSLRWVLSENPPPLLRYVVLQ